MPDLKPAPHRTIGEVAQIEDGHTCREHVAAMNVGEDLVQFTRVFAVLIEALIVPGNLDYPERDGHETVKLSKVVAV